ncbi:MAG: PadR family transcriptional regulator [Phycisphaerales bacterium]|nr:PadR family transcriptional regulator [Phycisphaerae bacterium]NNF41879.1 PadR family transcriptional regulator [Phycisphaerales bacterium]NNM25105.1 PadR family transcriptional regulator [Phycisphaerales bacterium]
MPRVNRTRFAVLGMLVAGPRSGYDLKQAFDEQIRHFWSESLGQIYPTLHRLRDEKLVSARTQRRPGRPERTVYTITARGRAAFEAWLTEPAAPSTVRNELLLKIFFGTEMSPEHVLEHIERHEASQRELRDLYTLFAREIDERPATAERRLYWKLALSSGRHINRARLAWCREAKAMIREQLAPARSDAR